MASLAKLIEAFRTSSGPYPWKDFVRLLNYLGYERVNAGKTGGSRRKYRNKNMNHLIMLDEPHGGEMGPGMVRRLQKELSDIGLI